MNTGSGITQRLVWLGLVGRLRTVGWWPWVALASWILVARLQEPSFFRQHGILLVHEGAVFGGTILLVVCSISCRPKYGAWIQELLESLAMVGMVAAAVATWLVALDLLLDGGSEASLALRVGMQLWFVGLPLQFAWGYPWPIGSRSRRWLHGCGLASLVPLLAGALRMPIGELASVAAASLLALGAARSAGCRGLVADHAERVPARALPPSTTAGGTPPGSPST
jgi:hypothetical protein